MRSHKRWRVGRLTVGWHVYTQDCMTTHRYRLVVQPFLFWAFR